jgi:hypothetical protein
VLQLDAATAGSGRLAASAGVCVVSAAFGVADAHGPVRLAEKPWLKVLFDERKTLFVG